MYKPTFIITPQINNQIAQIEKYLQIVKSSRIIPQQEIHLRYRATIESAHSSTSIEGNPLNIKQVQDAIVGKRVNATEQTINEVHNYKKALDWIEEKSGKKENISSQDALKIHALVMHQLLPTQKIGKVRSGSIYIVDEINNEEIVQYTGPKHYEVNSLLNNLFIWVATHKTILHPVLIAGIMHYEFLAIHPFSDGNGRVSRLLAKFFLHIQDYDFKGVLVLDNYYAENRKAYYKALSLGKTYLQRRRADLTTWLEYFVNGFAIEAENLAEEMSIISLKKTGPSIRVSKEEMEVLSFVQEFGRISLAETKGVLRGTERTVQRKLKHLVDEGLLKKQGQARATYYDLVL